LNSWSILCTLLLASNAIFSQASLGDGEKTGFAVFFVVFIVVTVSLCILQAGRQIIQKLKNNSNFPSNTLKVESQPEITGIDTAVSVGTKQTLEIRTP
jgi:uncharacterized membrane protein